jgi:hypothetical protein
MCEEDKITLYNLIHGVVIKNWIISIHLHLRIMPGPQLPWNEELDTLLLHCILAKGAHLTGTSDKWTSVNSMFFGQPELGDKRESHFVDGEAGYRKLKERMRKIIKTVEENKATGNQSGKEGDMSKLFEYVKQIVDEREAKREEKQDKRKLSETLNENERGIISRGGPLKVRLINGEIANNTQGQRKPKPSFEDRIIEFLDDSSGKQHQVDAQKRFEDRFTQWVNDTNKSVFELLEVSELNINNHMESVEEVGLKTLINIHCTRESDAPAAAFKTELKEFGLLPLVCSKLYMGLQLWRREVENIITQESITTPPSTVGSSSAGSALALTNT